MSEGPKSFQDAVKAFSRLPGIGQRTAQRLVIDLMKKQPEDSFALANALVTMRKTLKECELCFAYSDEAKCNVCLDSRRDMGLICVVEEASDVFAIERSGQFRGVYHVLHGRLAPLDGIGPKNLKIQELLTRVGQNPPREVLLATNPDVEGDATALYLARLLGQQNIEASRIAMGIPMGGQLEFLDQMTLGRAIAERRQFSIK